MKKLLGLVTILLTLSGCTRISDTLPKGVELELLKEVEVYNEASIKDILRDNNVEVLNKKDKINTNSLGNKDIEIKYKYNKKEYIYQTSIKVVDTEVPKILGGTNKTTLIGEEYNFCDHLFYGDNYDKKPKCDVEIDIDYEKVGTYTGNVIVTDSSGNKETKSIKLNVIKEYPKNNDTPKEVTPVLFSDVVSKHKTDNTLVGIDVSRWQKEIDFKSVKDAGCDFVIMRMGIQSHYDKEMSVDAYFEKNYENAKKNGLQVGIYMYSSANTPKMVKKQVKWMVKELKAKEIDLPVAYDWENWSKWSSYNMSFHDINEVYNAFKSELKKNKMDAMLYSSKYYLDNVWDTTDENNKVWLAHYTEKTNYQGNYYMWQLTSNGSIPGIEGYVDINVLYK